MRPVTVSDGRSGAFRRRRNLAVAFLRKRLVPHGSLGAADVHARGDPIG